VQFNELLEQLRRQRGLTKTALASRAQLSTGYVSSLISGVRQKPSLDTTVALAEALELGPDDRQALWQAAGSLTPPINPVGRSFAVAALTDTASTLKETGITSIRQGMSLALVQQWIYEATDLIRIQDTAMVDSLLALEDLFLSASLKRGVKMQILLLKPESMMAIQRSRDVWPPNSEEIDEQYVMKKIQSSLGELKRWMANGMKLQMRMYEAIPSFQLFACDDRALVGFFTYGSRASLGPQIEIAGRETLLGQFVTEEFGKLWQRADCILDNTAE
jgi:transcriptional regulator with XRE-family HTH domain